jgi:amino acid adenylation domain-containing protein
MSDSLYDLLRQAAARAGDQPAIAFGGRQLSYRQLQQDSDRAATLFTELGAGPGRRVAFCFRKSPEALIALFGLIRTGAAYVPLDPAWPTDRQEVICREADIALWVGNVAPGFTGLRHIVLAGLARSDAIAFDPAAHPPAQGPPAEPERGIANILYTSGSTGRPKGIEITALSLLHFSKWVVDYFDLGPADRVANHAPYNFDLSTLDIFAAVRAAATMCPVPEETKVLPFQMARLIAQQQITVWYSVPFALAAMLPKMGAHDLGRLRHVIFAGEVMPKPVLQELARALPHVTLTNLYGPTETNVCTYHRVDAADLSDPTPLPIGRAIADTRLWVVDEHGTPLDGPGLGELLVAGPTLTTGYFGDADLTARKLGPAPDGNGLAYRTGDVVSRGPDGVLLFHGRADRMLKCRGYRIEPGEIEAVLGRHPQVNEAAVLLAGTLGQDERLLACVAGAGGVQPAEAELTDWCRRSLPAYMIPEAWQFFEALPRTDRGKIDLQRLKGLAEGTAAE